MNKRFAARALKLRPDLAVEGDYFYYVPAGQILCGFVYEQMREHAYIWRFALPLYERLEFLNLSFGERLPQPAGAMRGLGTGSRAAEEFVRRIEPYDQGVRAWQDLSTFLHHFDSPRALENPWVRRSIAWTCILVGRAAEARAHLDILLSEDTQQMGSQFAEDIRRISALLGSGLDQAQQTLLAWQRETKQKFQIRGEEADDT